MMADRKNTEQGKSFGAAAGAQSETQPPRNDVKEQRGGPQEDQISGQTAKGAQNQAKENRNPQGNDPDRNQSGRQEGNTF
ncbi:MAG: hypothetical protein ACRD68_18285 [Pyrinomonadaceae bacterium]